MSHLTAVTLWGPGSLAHPDLAFTVSVRSATTAWSGAPLPSVLVPAQLPSLTILTLGTGGQASLPEWKQCLSR